MGGLKNSNRFSPNQVVYLLLTWMVARRPEVILRTIDDGSPGCLRAVSKKLLHSQKCININLFKTCYRGVKVKFWVFVALDFSSWKRFEQKKIEGGRESFSMQSSIILLLLTSLNHLSSLKANFYNFEIEIQRGEFQEWGFANTHLLGAVELANAVT